MILTKRVCIFYWNIKYYSFVTQIKWISRNHCTQKRVKGYTSVLSSKSCLIIDISSSFARVLQSMMTGACSHTTGLSAASPGSPGWFPGTSTLDHLVLPSGKGSLQPFRKTSFPLQNIKANEASQSNKRTLYNSKSLNWKIFRWCDYLFTVSHHFVLRIHPFLERTKSQQKPERRTIEKWQG